MPYPIEIPPRRRPQNDDGYLEELTKAIFRAGFSWPVIRRKWPDFVAAFDNFHVETVAGYDIPEINRLMHDPGIVRHVRKIKATIANARTILQLRKKHGSFYNFLRTLDGLSYEERKARLMQTFQHLGRTGCFVFLYCVGEDVPRWEER